MAGKGEQAASKTGEAPAVSTYRIEGSPGGGSGAIVVVVTSGTLTGKRAKIITTPPSAAYFNDVPKGSAT
jgi:hypothetical protein